MRPRLSTWLLLIAITVFAASGVAAELGVQRSSAGGVTVAITPQNLAASAKSWDFKVVLDTHSGDLNDDLVKSSLLLDGVGGRHAPLAWDGAPPGGHHPRGGAAVQARLSAAAIDRVANQARWRNRAALVPLATQIERR